MNKLNIEYIILFGSDRYHPDLHFAAARDRFDYITDARKAVKGYSNGQIYRVHYAKDSGDVLYFEEVR